MKIGIIGPLPPFRGGISHYNASLINSLKNTGVEVLPINFIKLYPGFLFPGSSEIDDKSQPFEKSISSLIAWNIFSWFKTASILKKNNIERLVVHLWHPFFVPSLLFISKQLKNVDLIVVAHNVLPHEKKWMGRLFNKYLFNRSVKIIVGGSREAEILLQEFNQNNSEVIPHPLYDKFGQLCADIDQQTAKKELGYKEDDLLFVHLGLVREYKGLDILIKALAKVENKSFKLLVAGEFYDDFDKYYQIVLQNNLQFISKIDNNYLSDLEMAKTFRAADYTILPYKRATQSGIAMASLACGTPVIASSVGALPDVLKYEEFGKLVEAENIEELTVIIDDIIKNRKTKTEEMSTIIRNKCEIEFSWEKLAKAVSEPV